MNICMIGTGYVGLVTGACFANLGNKVICVDIDKTKIDSLNSGICPIYEPGLEELVARSRKAKRLFFTTDLKDAVKKSQVVFIAVGTPPKEDGEADLTYIEDVSRQIAQSLTSYKLIIEKSTVPVETGNWIEHTIKMNNKRKVKFDVASNPEFLKEGSAIDDFMHPDRIVIGAESKRAKDILLKLYKPLKATTIVTDIKSAELIKHASNSFLATKISFINAISNICERAGADILEVAKGVGLDKRIGKDFLYAGAGFGGFCLPKDLDAFIRISEKLGYSLEILKIVRSINEDQKKILLKKIENNLWILKGKTVSILGLSFKPETDDIRFAPSIDIIKALLAEGVKIKAFDPKAMEKAKGKLTNVDFCSDPYSAVKNADCVVIMTEWKIFKNLDWKRVKKLVKQPLIVDGRNIFEDPKKIINIGFKYIAMGRKI
ncbi:MAG: UDP-glucose 6-dehydrogenase [Candidatus Omnitrophica bacterium CG07_land_8_20_14_0_80_42_15]|uniref:UDP-glucose 6-dehydrogenase n=1 Tax=Candidatus Aquitaenariimonas noxiae TaxID=1974741 RepID=A0A2J0KUP2_9BACT|nr:MAG: UDP-glucose 6-dehydrogenase [Candidatus Omnitrophica bacterium CG07_land_8_20_14_0_80_42_15]